MNVSAKYIKDATGSLEKCMRANRLALVSTFGKVDYSTKSDRTIVTKMDEIIEKKIVEALLALDSDVGIIGEETGSQGDKTVYWLIDPIDGTEQFVRGLQGCVNMACLIVDNEPVVSIIYDFINDNMYVANKNNGAFCNDKAIHVSNRPIDRAWIEFAFRRDQPEIVPALTTLMQECNIVRLRNSLLVSTGNIDGIVVVGGKGGLWDYAPRALMIQEAGGKVANIGSTSYDFKNTSFIASNPVVFDTLQKILSECIST